MTGLCHENLIPDSWQQWKQDKIDNITEFEDLAGSNADAPTALAAKMAEAMLD